MMYRSASAVAGFLGFFFFFFFFFFFMFCPEYFFV